MKFSDSIKVFGLGVLAAGFLSTSFAANRVGPVSAYGELQAGKNSYGKGQIYGACKGVADGAEVAVQGMSLFWSIASDVGAPFWTADHVSKLVKEQNIQLIRAPMGVDGDWGAGNYFTNEKYYKGLMDVVVQAAIDNDIYVIIDYHSHNAADNVNNAKAFFTTMAREWGGYDNVIFEIFNEPLENQSWGSIKTYADEVVKTIRQYSDNLIVVGNRSWDQYPNEAASNPVTDSKNNTAYTFHYYAGSHDTDQEGANAVSAMNSGLSVFVTEWGTVHSSGNTNFNASNSTTWYNWMKTHKLSGANWSVSNKAEDASYYSGSADNPSYTTSGQWVNSNVFASLPKSYTACDGSVPVSSSSSAKSSSSVASSSSAKSSSSVASSSSAKSSSSIASSSSAKSSSSVASSSSAKSSSSVASSSSVRSSSSAKSSSSASTQVVVVGDLEQTVAQGGQFETVTFKNVQAFDRETWNFHFLKFEQSGSEVTVAGSVPDYVQVGDLTETLTINNTKYEIKLTVAGAASSSSALVDNSSSSSAEVSSSSEEHTTVVQMVSVNPLKVSMNGRLLQITGADYAEIDVFDMQGSPVASFKQAAGSVSLESLRQGNYIVRVRSGSNSLTRRIVMK